MSAVGSIAEIIAKALGMVDEYIEDPKRRLEVRLKIKESMRLQTMELIKKEKTGEEADILARFMLSVINKL